MALVDGPADCRRSGTWSTDSGPKGPAGALGEVSDGGRVSLCRALPHLGGCFHRCPVAPRGGIDLLPDSAVRKLVCLSLDRVAGKLGTFRGCEAPQLAWEVSAGGLEASARQSGRWTRQRSQRGSEGPERPSSEGKDRACYSARDAAPRTPPALLERAPLRAE